MALVHYDRWIARKRGRSMLGPGAASVAECIAHLNLTSHAYIPLLHSALAQHPPRDPPPQRYRRDFVGWLIGIAAGPLPHIGRVRFGRAQTAPAFVPGGDLDRERTLGEFELLQDEQIGLTNAAHGRPLEEIRIVSPFDARVRYNAYSCLVLLPRHQFRHLWQAEHVWSGSR